jgi:1-deoxy-D-xylulose-5-phosphate reductoisomerase
MKKKNVVILGSTGSIGKNALDVVRHHKKRFNVVGLAANRNASLMAEQIREFNPQAVAMSDTPAAEELRSQLSAKRSRVPVWNHSDGMERLARLKEADVVLSDLEAHTPLRSVIPGTCGHPRVPEEVRVVTDDLEDLDGLSV